ncbi:MAG: polyhydroxyalkanoate synthesis regulator DNA-binding domain-containing protein [Myxococcota bacterium]
MSGPKIVKRYANRKLYDTERSCYVTLEDISIMIKSGEEVRVVDNKSGEDLTTVTLAQIIFEAEKKKAFMPLSLLRDLIRERGDALGEFAKDRVDRVQAGARELKEQAEKTLHDIEDKIGGVVRKGDQGEGSGANDGKNSLSEALANSQKALDDLQKGIEDRVKGPVDAVSRYANLGKDMDEIRKRLASLEHRLEQLP